MIHFKEWAETWTMREPACVPEVIKIGDTDYDSLNVAALVNVLPTEVRITALRLRTYETDSEVEDLIWSCDLVSRVLANWLTCREAWAWDAEGNPTRREETNE